MPLGLSDEFFRGLLSVSKEFTDDLFAAIRQKDIESLIHQKACQLIEELWGLRDSSKLVKFQDTHSQNIIIRLAAIPSYPLLEKACTTLRAKLMSIRNSLEPEAELDQGVLENQPPLMITLSTALQTDTAPN
jgi:hypothetical protein